MNHGRSNPSRRQLRVRLAYQLIAAIGISAGSTAAAVDPVGDSLVTTEPRPTAEFMLTSSLRTMLIQPPSQTAPTAPAQDRAGEQIDASATINPGPTPAPSPSDLPPPVAQPEDDAGTLPPPALPPQLTNATASRSALGITFGSASAVPTMMGDLFGGLLSLQSNFDSTVALAGGDRRFKIAENVSPLPQDRIFFNYNHFHNALTDVGGVTHSLDRFTLGLEKTFFDGGASVEVRLPIISGLNSFQSMNDDNTDVEVGNLGLYVKAILISAPDWAVSGGLAMTLPTSRDAEAATDSDFIEIESDAVHLAPFLGYVARPNRCWFAQGFIQADFDLNGNDVYDGTFSDRVYRGTARDQNLLFLDASVGRWIHRSCDPCNRVRAVAAVAELHYTTTLNDTDSVSPLGGSYTISNPYNRMDILNATGALVIRYPNASLRFGGAAPLRNGEERLFDAEFIFQFNRFF